MIPVVTTPLRLPFFPPSGSPFFFLPRIFIFVSSLWRTSPRAAWRPSSSWAGAHAAAASWGGKLDQISIRPADRASVAMLAALLAGANRQTLSSRDALITAAGDSAVEAIFRFLGNPAEAQKLKDKHVLFGVAMVAVNPGWRTRKGFAADIGVTTHYAFKPARLEVIERLLRDPRLSRDLQRRIAEDNDLGEKKEKDRPLELTGGSRKIPRIPGWLLAPVAPLSANPP